MPEPYGGIPASGGNLGAIRRKSDGCDRITVSPQSAKTGACVGIPDFQGVILAAAGNLGAVRGVCDAENTSAVTLER